jgi:hypothetical protein
MTHVFLERYKARLKLLFLLILQSCRFRPTFIPSTKSKTEMYDTVIQYDTSDTHRLFILVSTNFAA